MPIIKNGTTIFIIGLVAITSLAIIAASYRYFVVRDYVVIAHVTCEPTSESCFIGDSEFATFYKIIVKPAYTIPACDGWKGTCPELSCNEGELGCKEILCDPDLESNCSKSSQVKQ